MASVTFPDAATQRTTHRPISARIAGLARAVEGSRGSKLDVRAMLLAAGSTCMGLGLVAIVLGWYGAAHSAYQFQEIPYLISGGLLGVALVAAGGFLFFSSWLVRMMEDNHRHATRVERTLERVDHVLGAIADDAALATFVQGPEPSEAARGADEPSGWMGGYREAASYPLGAPDLLGGGHGSGPATPGPEGPG